MQPQKDQDQALLQTTSPLWVGLAARDRGSPGSPAAPGTAVLPRPQRVNGHRQVDAVRVRGSSEPSVWPHFPGAQERQHLGLGLEDLLRDFIRSSHAPPPEPRLCARACAGWSHQAGSSVQVEWGPVGARKAAQWSGRESFLKEVMLAVPSQPGRGGGRVFLAENTL